MKTVLPARERPVTPSRNVGWVRVLARSARLSNAISALSVRDVREGGNGSFPAVFHGHGFNIGRGDCPKRSATADFLWAIFGNVLIARRCGYLPGERKSTSRQRFLPFPALSS